MAVLYDSRGNELLFSTDQLQGGVLTETRSLSASLGAVAAETFVDIAGHNTIAIDIRGTFVATVLFEATIDGTNYFQVVATNILTQTQVIGATAVQQAVIACAGYKRVRTRCSAYTSGSVVVSMRASFASLPPQFETPPPTQLWVTATAAANTGFTLTLPAAGAGLFHYITHIDLIRNATAALVGSATLIYTTTNLPGSPAWSVGNAMAIGGTQLDLAIDFALPLKSSAANTATTLVVPAHGAAVLGRANVGYFVGA